jgi:pyruvate kinase
VGELAVPRTLVPGETVVFAPEDLASGDELPTTYEALARDVRPGARILLNDGLLAVEVTQVAPPRVEVRVVDGGVLTSHKGMNLRGGAARRPTEKDREDVAHAVRHGADYVALSFCSGRRTRSRARRARVRAARGEDREGGSSRT